MTRSPADTVKHTLPTLKWRYVPAHIAEGAPEVRHEDGWIVCETCSDDYARLMAAAPQLLSALRLVEEHYAEDSDVFRVVRAAIAKAEGRSS